MSDRMHAVTRLTNTIALCLVALATSCASNRYFRPAERANAETADGFLASQYELDINQQRWGEVRVWSEGAWVWAEEGESDTLLHVGIEIENALDSPLALNLAETRIEEVRVGDITIDRIDTHDIVGEPQVDGHTVGKVHFEFTLPEGYSPRHVRSFRMRWQLLGPDDVLYEQHTPFTSQRSRWGHRRYYAPPHWYWRPAFVGWGFGYRSGWCW